MLIKQKSGEENNIAYATKAQEIAKQKGSIEEESEEALSRFFISTLPWLSFTSLIQPVSIPNQQDP